mgnify:CR=1 FL=1|jgi:uncharacterized protein (DUF983 family)|tara:strand:+ start:197693 stop:198118 length:426 start_codon:yes stop_codon:yes gene_type:complete
MNEHNKKDTEDQNETGAVLKLIKTALFCRCPKCNKSGIFKQGLFNFDLEENCTSCGLDLTRSDSADGPAVFLIFILGFLLVPLALIVEVKVGWPTWLHVAVWGTLGLIITLWALKPIKALVIALQYRFRTSDWDKNPPPRA